MQFRTGQLQDRSRPDPFRSDPASGHENVGVVADVCRAGARQMYRHIDAGPISISQFLPETTCKLNALRRTQLPGQDHHRLAPEPGIAEPGSLRTIPQGRPVPGPIHIGAPREFSGKQNFLMNDIVAVTEVVNRSSALISNPLTRSISRRPGDTSALAPGENLDVDLVDRHVALPPMSGSQQPEIIGLPLADPNNAPCWQSVDRMRPNFFHIAHACWCAANIHDEYAR